MARFRFTDASVRSSEIPARGYRLDFDVQGGPRQSFVRGFALRTTATGKRTFLLAYTNASGREVRHRIGDFGPHSVTSAREAAEKLRRQIDGGHDPHAEAKATREAADAKRKRDAATFGGLMGAYVAQLRRAGKNSARAVETGLHHCVEVPFAKLWALPAAAVTLDDLVRITNRLTKAGQWRQAEKIRAYIRAAYTAAVASRGDAMTADLYRPYSHIVNIARDMATIHRPKELSAPNDKRALSLAELSAYWRRIEAMTDPHGALLRFHLLTGAQRVKQLARLTTADFDADEHTITLHDPKGRRKVARVHVVPLIPDALAALDGLHGDAGPFLFSVDGGAHAAVYHTLRSLMRCVAAQMVEAGEVETTFTPGEMRITVETRLAAAGVPMETRAQLQSHGLGGVQARYYDKHGYLAEKRAALARLRGLLAPGTKVVPLRRARR
ncbi:MAG TPA: integrase family protein [Rhodanobacteraceae bacterium]